jgi:hypothetical protein
VRYEYFFELREKIDFQKNNEKELFCVWNASTAPKLNCRESLSVVSGNMSDDAYFWRK